MGVFRPSIRISPLHTEGLKRHGRKVLKNLESVAAYPSLNSCFCSCFIYFVICIVALAACNCNCPSKQSFAVEMHDCFVATCFSNGKLNESSVIISHAICAATLKVGIPQLLGRSAAAKRQRMEWD